MTSPDQDEQLPEQVNRALASDTVAPSAETDQRILQFAAQQVPSAPSSGWKTWMPATAACCLVGVLTFSLLPEQQAEPVQSMEVDMQLTKSRETIGELAREVTAQSDEAHADTVLADELPLPFEESDVSINAATSNFAAATAPAKPVRPTKIHNIVQLPPDMFERLLVLSEQKHAAKGFSDGFARSSPASLTRQTAKKREQHSAVTDSSSLVRAKTNRDNDNQLTYETLRNECNCDLPDSLQQALDMLARQQIQSDNSEPQAMSNKQ